MRQIVQRMTVLALALLIALPLCAEDAKEGKKKKKEQDFSKSPVLNVLNLPKAITLTADQQAKFDAVKTEFTGKLKELAKKQNEILTPEQKKARQEAQKAAKAAGKKGKEAKADVDAAVNLTDDQKKATEAVNAEIKEVQGKVREKLNEFLTDEQKAQIKGPGKKKKAKANA